MAAWLAPEGAEGGGVIECQHIERVVFCSMDEAGDITMHVVSDRRGPVFLTDPATLPEAIRAALHQSQRQHPARALSEDAT